MCMGGHVIKTWSKDQSVIALSSGEAELHAANYGSAQALGLCSFANDLGVNLNVNLLIDAKATVGVIRRRGLGKVRHIEVQDLWLQEAVKGKKIQLEKVPSARNTADLMTKPLTRAEIWNHMGNLGADWH